MGGASLESGETEILNRAQPEFERILLEAALSHTNGHKQDAAKVLGWGRNTLTRKLKELY
ncbi:nitrogen regulation protein NR(I) [Vibrio variabilis]|uniref:Nitrogen regulation protein NR(I) n=1 Tax=Vibrio variabilis TaxID=990271 RepID=A0ABQ0JKH8_9VIBR|nr:nitrogen regulation protein NR(I) [Vibrio variabilis]